MDIELKKKPSLLLLKLRREEEVIRSEVDTGSRGQAESGREWEGKGREMKGKQENENGNWNGNILQLEEIRSPYIRRRIYTDR